MLKLYNTLTRKKGTFKPIHKNEVGMYSCGPTVYNYPHIGNYRAYLVADLLKRYLKFRGFKVKHIMNITDVDDKTIRDSQKEGVSLKEFTSRYTAAFIEDLNSLNIEMPSIFCKATEHVTEMADAVKTLMDKGYAYKGEDGCVYYSVSKFPDYGRLAHIKVKELKAGARVKQDEYTKETASDFALWKAWDSTDGPVFWETSFGKGRPGWHIECSVMSTKYLGNHFDIHTGGVDLIFPHHQNEIAQAEAITGEKFVNYWIHNEWLLVEGKKMSKSLGNFYTLRDILAKGYSPMAVRYTLLSTHYRQQLNFTFADLDAAKSALQRLQDFLLRLESMDGQHNHAIPSLIEKAKIDFEKAMDDDLEISKGLAVMFEFVREVNKLEMSKEDAVKVIEFMKLLNSVLGFMNFEKAEVPAEIMGLVNEREEARKVKDFAKADSIRAKLKEKGYVVEDSAKGIVVKKV